jgi:putative FmdB family regulatory protein
MEGVEVPIYEYECEKCGVIEEVFQKISDKPLRKCGHCAGNVHKLISQSSFHLKGTGWYVTDYAGKKSKPSAPAKAEKASDTSTDTTPKASSTESAKSD